MSQEAGQTDAILVQAVHDAYNAKAKADADESYSNNVAKAFGYTPEQLQAIPAESHMGLSCGNPVAAASVKEGENVLDVGSGGGIDVLLAASKVGPKGQAIGLDISADMISRARRNAQKQNLRPPQVAFVHASLTEPLPISSDSIDCILSNCVINLLPLSGKASIFKEAHRVLKPGGRVVLDDIVARRPLPETIRNDLATYVGCIAGAIEMDTYKALLSEAGLTDVVFVDTLGDLNVYFNSETPSSGECCSAEPSDPCASDCPWTSIPLQRPSKDFDANLWAASYQIYALKPASSSAVAAETPAPLLRWWDAYPTVQSSPATITNSEVATFIRDNTLGPSDYAVIDVRRNDHAGGHVRGSFQCPAQTFYDDLPGFFERFGKLSKVIFYCSSSNGRGPRCAGWYQDYLNDKCNTTSKAYVLEGGVKAWLKKFGDDVELVDKD